MANEPSKSSFWTTLPGLLTALAATIGAVATLVTALNNTGVFRAPQSAAPARPAGVAPASPPPSAPSEPAANAPAGAPAAPTSAAAPVAVDRSDPASTAAAVLRAYRARDVIAMAGLNNAANRQIFLELAAQGEAHPRYKSFFSGWRWASVQTWDGRVGETRYRNARAYVKYGAREDRVLAVVLDFADGQWTFEDLNAPSAADFAAMSLTK